MNANITSLPADDRYVLLTIQRLCAQSNGRPVSRSAIAADMLHNGIPARRRTRQALLASIMALTAGGHVVLSGKQRVRPAGRIDPVKHRVRETVNLSGRRCAVCDTCKRMIERWPLNDDNELLHGDRRWKIRVAKFRQKHPEVISQ